jgi:regulator of sirC expression with transglutaminase-like and TPR domain
MELDGMLRQLAHDPTAPVDLAALALALAAEEYPTLDVASHLSQLELIADQLHLRLDARLDLQGHVEALTTLLFEELGFRGATEDYYSPLNSYLNKVLDRRRGIPITLTLLAMTVGKRCGLTIEGVGLPGHFIARASDETGDTLYFDPFHGGRLLDESACSALVEAVTGQPFTVSEASLAAVSSAAMVQRMLTNLKLAYIRTEDYRRAARITARLARLCPTDWSQRRDLGIFLARTGELGRAIPHLQKYLRHNPDAADHRDVQRILRDAWGEVARWN